MRLIISRKGFDSASGGCPSPIFDDGTMCSLPIPDKESGIPYSALRHNHLDLGEIVRDLTNGRKRQDYSAHLDPDLCFDTYPGERKPGWRRLLGSKGQRKATYGTRAFRLEIFSFFSDCSAKWNKVIKAGDFVKVPLNNM